MKFSIRLVIIQVPTSEKFLFQGSRMQFLKCFRRKVVKQMKMDWYFSLRRLNLCAVQAAHESGAVIVP